MRIQYRIVALTILGVCLAVGPSANAATSQKSQDKKIKGLETRVKSLNTRLTKLEKGNSALISCFATVRVSQFGDTLGNGTDGYDYQDIPPGLAFRTTALDLVVAPTGGTDFVIVSPACAAIFNAPAAAALARLTAARAFSPFLVSLVPLAKSAADR